LIPEGNRIAAKGLDGDVSCASRQSQKIK
jgi:hypothetical protein